jgi:hypothetical protein
MRGMKLFFLFACALPLLPLLARSRESDPQRSVALFRETLKVFRHPRCLNCHPSGDQPTQGNDMHPHIMNVQRGLDDRGFVALRCATCHGTQNFNLDARHGVPGAPKWAVAPREMAWQGLSDRELCLALKDPRKTHKTMEEMIEHNAHDKLVGWGWHPGAGREPAPGTQEEFGKLFAEWVATGAVCP